MSYNYKIYIWEQFSGHPEPATFEAGGQAMPAQQGAKAAVNAKFVALVQQLLKHHPSQASAQSCHKSALTSGC